MLRILVAAMLAAVIAACCATVTSAQGPFKAPEVTSAPDIQYPIQSIADGIVVLDLSLDDMGAVTRVSVTRDILSLTSVATASIQSWKFTAASSHGNPQPSTVRVAFVFRPRSYFAADPPFAPVLSGGGPSRVDQSYVPPGIIAVTYPQYPIKAVIPGTVVIQVTVGKSRSIQRLKVVRDLPPFTQLALNAVNRWGFQAATLDSKPVPSVLVVAFVFPTLSQP